MGWRGSNEKSKGWEGGQGAYRKSKGIRAASRGSYVVRGDV